MVVSVNSPKQVLFVTVTVSSHLLHLKPDIFSPAVTWFKLSSTLRLCLTCKLMQ